LRVHLHLRMREVECGEFKKKYDACKHKLFYYTQFMQNTLKRKRFAHPYDI